MSSNRYQHGGAGYSNILVTHIPSPEMTPTALLKFQERIISAMEDPASSDLLILARGLGLRRIVCSLLKLYLSSGKLVVLVGASNLEEDQSIGSQLSTMGVRNPGLRVVGHEMDKKVR